MGDVNCNEDNSSDSDNNADATTMADSGFNSRGIGLRAQKKVLSKMATKKIAKAFIDDTMGELLDAGYQLCKDYIVTIKGGSKKEAEKVIKNIIKVTVKIGVLYKHDQFNQDELLIAEEFRKKFRSTIMTFVSFYEVDFSFDKNYLMKSLNECRDKLRRLVKRHLTEKSLNRIDHVFNFFADGEFLETVFESDTKCRIHLNQIVKGFNKLLEEEGI
ncbi:tumor necrosis factor alpha-induced protein 8-like protein [Anneissia japonica]|uniref:tumor necrosis factor alpha-induced protein 8-like protein n=1 Tax=Anneissia japonica TaxID=1529436 RepID=UPI001425A005|nr:tumor necrosis factor alpha-induced protein 8-like protein [Anneissia japonica]